jgi:hypothetical protein
VPEAADLMAFNRQLLDWCMATAVRVITGRATSVGVAMGEERPQLLPLADLGLGSSEILFPGIVVGKGSGRGREGVRARQSQPLFDTAWAEYWGVHTGASA